VTRPPIVATTGDVARMSACSTRHGERGQSLVESTFVLLIFLAILLGVLDCAQVLFAHQSLVERVNLAVRWGSVHAWNGPDPVRNLVLYNQTGEPRATTDGYLGLRRENVVVNYQPPTAEDPDDETLSVSIVNFETHLFSPWIAQKLVSPRPVLVTAPMAYRTPLPEAPAQENAAN
jgi:hypothetical protein